MVRATDKPSTFAELLAAGYLDVLLLILSAPPALAAAWFPRPLTVLALLLLSLPFFIRYRLTGRPTRHTPVNLLIALLLVVVLPVTLWISPLRWEVTWPRIATLVWSAALFFTVVNWRGANGRALEERLRGPTIAYLALGLTSAVVGLLGMRSVNKLFSLPLPSLLGAEGLPTNEIAGVLTLFVPFAGALSLQHLQKRSRLSAALGLYTVFLLGVLVLTQSRTGLVSAALGLTLAWVLVVRPRRRWLVAGLAVVGVAFIVLSLAGLLDRFIFAGANSWASVFGPRLNIWRQALLALPDFSIWGMGLGLFGRLSPLLYPLMPVDQAPLLEDAHNLYLQTFLDFGLLGGLAALSILFIGLFHAYRLTRRNAPGSVGLAWSAGLLAALVAHLLYSLTDAVALGTPAGIPLWFCLGLVMAATEDRQGRAFSLSREAAVFAVVALALFAVWAWLALPMNRVARLTSAGLLDVAGDPAANAPNVRQVGGGQCRSYWYEGLLYHAAGQSQPRNTAWASALDCSPRFLPYMSVLAAQDEALARHALQAQPGSADAYFWPADITATAHPDQAVVLLRQGLALEPENGARWLQLGDLLLSAEDLPGALEAFLGACRNGDPGANGCWRAGGVAERQGDIPAAIGYYRLSNWSGALERADELEHQLSGE